jgi:hypothetical protein
MGCALEKNKNTEGWEKKNRISSWVGKKNTLLQALSSGLACSGLQESIFCSVGITIQD